MRSDVNHTREPNAQHWPLVRSPDLAQGLTAFPTILLLERTCFSALQSRRMPDARTVVVYSRKGCHLCEVVKESLSKLSRRGGFTWQEVDVDLDFELRRQFNDEVPVVFIDGRKAFKYHMDEQEFLAETGQLKLVVRIPFFPLQSLPACSAPNSTPILTTSFCTTLYLSPAAVMRPRPRW